jgi:uncharacterized protein YcbK (DUF882 family)
MRSPTAHPALGFGAATLFVALWSATAGADVQHTVARGHTIEAIAHRYHVTVKAIVDANHLRDPRHLKVGETLVIPGVSAPKTATGKGATGKAGAPVSYAMRAKTPGVVHITRLATSEDFVVRVSSRRGHVAPTALKTFERVMRSTTGATHPPEPRLLSLMGQVSNHFGSRRIEVISGFRPYSPTQYTAHSNHNIGHAMGFRVVGVPNEVLRDYCKTLKNVGVGYYPNSTFVHLDVRDTPATWVDFSKPGEPPRYNVPGVDADEGTSDVSEEAVTPESAAPSQAPLWPLPATGSSTPAAQTPMDPAAAPTPPAAPPAPAPTASAPNPLPAIPTVPAPATPVSPSR